MTSSTLEVEFANVGGEGGGCEKSTYKANDPHAGGITDWRVELKYVSAGLPKPTGWQPVPPEITSLHKSPLPPERKK